MARRKDHTRKELKNMILEVSWGIVEKEGFSGLSARRIASEIGYAPGTIYNVFDSMEGLYLEINSRTLDMLRDVLMCPDCNCADNTPIENIKEMARQYRGFVKEHRNHWLMLFSRIMPEGQSVPEFYQEKIAGLFRPLENLLLPFYRDKTKRELKIAARVLWSSVHGLCFLEETGKMPLVSNQEKPEDMTDYLIENFIRGVGGKACCSLQRNSNGTTKPTRNPPGSD